MNRILITGAVGSGYGAQVAKALHHSGRYELIGADSRSGHPSYVPFHEMVSLPRANDPRYFDALVEQYRRVGAIALFEGSEPELKFLSHSRQRLRDAGIHWVANGEGPIDLCMDKRKLSSWLASRGFSSPKGWEISSLEDMRSIDRYPVVVKPNENSGASNHVYVAQSFDELSGLFTWLGLPFSDFCFQEYVGTPDDEYTVGVLSDANADLIASIALRRNLSSVLSRRFWVPNRTSRKELSDMLVVSSGVSQGTIDDHPKIQKTCEEISKALGSTGPLNIQGRWHEGRFYVFEINPRFSGTTCMRAMAGLNEPELLLLSSMGSPRAFKIQHGLTFRRDLLESIEP